MDELWDQGESPDCKAGCSQERGCQTAPSLLKRRVPPLTSKHLATQAFKSIFDHDGFLPEREGEKDELEAPSSKSSSWASCEKVAAPKPTRSILQNKGSTRVVDGPMKPFRTLVVVPRSHADGSYTRLRGKSSGERKVNLQDTSIISRAVQLDLRPDDSSPHESLFIAWDSRVVHQGHTHRPGDNGWDPPLLRPPLFHLEDPAWKASLQEEGFIVIKDPLTSDEVEKALEHLLADLQLLNPGLRSLEEVREKHLPSAASANDLRTGGGLSHGNFAWFLRCRPQVSRIFESLFGLPEGAAMTGSVDCVALAPPGCSSSRRHSKQWLHLDYTPPQGTIWQACIQLFPRDFSHGKGWERIAAMVCKAPASWTSDEARHALLACCVTGTTSRATAGVTLGKVHGELKDEPADGIRRLLPELVDSPLAMASSCSAVSDASASPHSLWRRCSPLEAMREHSAKALSAMLPASKVLYVAPNLAPRQTEGVKPALQRQRPSLLGLFARRRDAVFAAAEAAAAAAAAAADLQLAVPAECDNDAATVQREPQRWKRLRIA